MIKSVIKWGGLALLACLLAGAAILAIGSYTSLDHERGYSRTVAALPAYQRGDGNGIFRIAINDMTFRVRLNGCEPDEPGATGPAVIMLHGFPASSAMWERLSNALVQSGYCVIAPDQRGYSPGARPLAVEDYRVDHLSDDVLALADALGKERFHLIGHDWGSVVGWTTVLRAPQRIVSWTGLSIAHPTAFSEALATDPDQQARSRYFFLFTTPWLPEALLSFSDFALLKAGYDGMRAAHVTEYLGILSEPGALTAVFNWYRAMDLGQQATAGISPQVQTPTLFIWGNNDVAAGRAAVEMQAQYMLGPYKEVELDAGHWLTREKPNQVIEEVRDHLAANSVSQD